MSEADADFDQLFAAEFTSVLRTVYLICHDHHRAQDLTQDAFVQLLRQWDKVRTFDRPGAWVRRVAIRLAVRSVRREARRVVAERDSRPPTDSDPDDREVLEAVRRLPPKQRAAVVLYYYEDAPVAEIADLIGCAPATARVHLHRARARLGELLSEEVSRRAD